MWQRVCVSGNEAQSQPEPGGIFTKLSGELYNPTLIRRKPSALRLLSPVELLLARSCLFVQSRRSSTFAGVWFYAGIRRQRPHSLGPAGAS